MKTRIWGMLKRKMKLVEDFKTEINNLRTNSLKRYEHLCEQNQEILKKLEEIKRLTPASGQIQRGNVFARGKVVKRNTESTVTVDGRSPLQRLDFPQDNSDHHQGKQNHRDQIRTKDQGHEERGKPDAPKTLSLVGQQPSKPEMNYLSLSERGTRDERDIYEKYQRQCLSRALKSLFAVIIEKSQDINCSNIPDWVSEKEREDIRNSKREKNGLRKFLCLLMKQSFERMHDWLIHSKLDEDTKSKVQKKYEELSICGSKEEKCFRCNLFDTICVTRIADHLFELGVLSDRHFAELIETCNETGSQENDWILIISLCRNSDKTLKPLKIAISKFLTNEIYKGEGNGKFEHHKILTEMESLDGDGQDPFICRCVKHNQQFLNQNQVSMIGVHMSPRIKTRDSECSTDQLKNAENSTDEVVVEDTGAMSSTNLLHAVALYQSVSDSNSLDKEKRPVDFERCHSGPFSQENATAAQAHNYQNSVCSKCGAAERTNDQGLTVSAHQVFLGSQITQVINSKCQREDDSDEAMSTDL